MKPILLAAASLAAVCSVAGSAQSASAPAKSCYIEIRMLMAPPPAGIGDLGTAIRALDAALRPQVLAIDAIKSQIARLEQRQETAGASTSIEAAFADEPGAALPTLPMDDRTAGQVRRFQSELDTRRTQLKADYIAQQRALVGPVQERINRGAKTFAASKGCGDLKMARHSDLPALAAARSRDVTSEFVTWFATRTT